MRKTNRYWCGFPEYGTYFRLVGGVLMAAAMNAEGTIVFDKSVWPTLIIGNGPPWPTST